MRFADTNVLLYAISRDPEERGKAERAIPSAGMPSDAFERAVSQRPTQVPLRGRVDRYELDLPSAPVAPTATATGSGREIEWPQIGIGFGLGLLLAVGLGLALRTLRIRPLAH